MTTERALLRDLMDVFMGFPPRRPKKVINTSRPEPAQLEDPSLVVPVEHEPKVDHVDVVELQPRKVKAAVTNTTGAQAVASEDVVATIDRVESVPKVERNDLRPRSSSVTNTNAARQSRWRSKQDAGALRLQAQARMKLLRARRRAAGP